MFKTLATIAVFSLLTSFNLAFAEGTKLEGAKLEAAKTLYESKCAKCHGKSGQGDGRKGKDLTPTPTDFTDAKILAKYKEKAPGLSDDERMFKSTKEGGPSVKQGKGMDAFGKGIDKGTLTDEEIKDLVEYCKSFRK